MRNSGLVPRSLGRLVVGLALITAACAPRIATHGNLPDPDRLSEVVPGQMSKNEVSEILGSPSSVAAFDDETWYYISERQETTAWLPPDTTERKVVVIHFNKKGVVSKVETLGLKDGRIIQPVARTTPTAGSELTIIQQILGNLGRFNKQAQ